MTTLLHPTYFPNIASYVGLLMAEKPCFEIYDTYQKQTYRNRTHIYGANGKLVLNVPVIYSQKNRQLYKDVKIFNDEKWQINHWKSLQSAYKTSPFFEYYEDDLAPLFHNNFDFIMDFNFECMAVIAECMQVDMIYETTTTFEKNPEQTKDLRFLVNARKEKAINMSRYTQVFSGRHGFLNNLSILDLLFNEGPNTIIYLRSQKNKLENH